MDRFIAQSTSLLLATSIALVPINSVLAASTESETAATNRVEGLFSTANCDNSREQVASTAYKAAESNPVTSAAGKTDTVVAPNRSPGAEASATASAIPSETASPVRVPLRGPGVLVPSFPSANPTSQLTPPPIPTPTMAVTPMAGPIFITRNSPTPAASDRPVSPAATTLPSPSPSALPTTPAGSPTTSATGTNSGTGTSQASVATPVPTNTPSPAATLGPNQVAILADTVDGGTRMDLPADAIGNVHIFYRDGVLIGDRAHYDGVRYVTMSGNTYIENNAKDTRLYGDQIVFDLQTNHAVLQNGRGVTSRGVEQGFIHYRASNLDVSTSGRVHGDRASFSTCENPRGGYHIAARSIDVVPGHKLIAHSATVFLGALAIFYLPVLTIPLDRSSGQRRPVPFAPEFGYDQVDGFYVKAHLGFGTTSNYYGYYRVEEFTKRGLGLGYVAFIGSRSGKRQLNIDAYDLGNGRNDNLNIRDHEAFSSHLFGDFSGSRTSDYGPFASLPPSYGFSGTVNHTTPRSTQNYAFSRSALGSSQSTITTAIQDTYRVSNNLNQAIALNLSQNQNSYTGTSSTSSTLHLNSLTTASSKNADYTLTVDQTDSASPGGYNTVPEFTFHPHGGHGALPIDTQLSLGTYHELTDFTDASGRVLPGAEAQRSAVKVHAGPAVFRVFHASTLSANLDVDQYYYSTGDLKAQTAQTLNLTSPFGRHFSNVIQYQEQNLSGPQSLPFRSLDVLGSVTHNAQETFNISNGGIYTLSLTTGTAFNHQSEPIQYQLSTRPSPRSFLSIGGSYNPSGFSRFSNTNVQVSTPIGRNQTVEFTTNVDWNNHAQLRNKNIYFRKIVGNCYDLRLSYNQDLKAVNLTLDLLAFPSRGVNFGFTSQQQAIIPQNFAF